MATLTGKTIGNYQIENELGRGAMGVVYKAKQLSMDRFVALKFLPKRLAQDDRILQRFLREARAAGQLSHPHIVSVHDVGVLEGFHYIAMELVDGNSVQSHVKDRGPYKEKEALEIARQIAEALKYAHGRGILHRDIKPDNFLIDSHGRVRLADLGLARVQQPGDSKEADLTQDGTALGTPHYMSPEQCKGEHVDARSDIYGLGAALYVMVSNHTPYEAPTAAAVMVKVITEPPKSLKKFCPNLSPGFIAFVEKLMAKDPAKRFPDAQHVLEAIEKVKSGTYKVGTSHHPKVPAHAQLSHAPRYKLVLMGAGAAIVALFALAFFAGRNKNNDVSKVEKDKENTEAVATTNGGAQTQPNIPAAHTDGAKTETPKPPDFTAGKKDDDDEPAGKEARRRWRMMEDEIQSRGRKDPTAAIARVEEFLRTFPRAKPGVQRHLDHLREVEAKLKKDYATARAESEAAYKAGDRKRSFDAYQRFIREHEGTQLADEWTGQVRTQFLQELRNEAQRVAKTGDLDKAENILSAVLKASPKEQVAAVQRELDQIVSEKKRLAAEREADEKRIADLQTRARSAVLEAEMPSGKRYDVSKALALMNAEIGQFKTEATRKTAEALVQVYERAGDVVKRMKLAVNAKSDIELSSLGTYRFTCIVQKWEDAALLFKTPNLPQQQTAMLKNVTPDNMLELARKVSIGTGASSADQFDLGSLAFAIGADSVAAQSFEKIANDVALQPAVNAVKRFLKLDSAAASLPDDREAAAQKTYNDLVTAREKKDQATVLKLSTQLVLDYADTQFVKARQKQIQQLSAPGNDPVEPVATAPAPAENDPAEAELKKIGFATVGGEWQMDKALKGGFITQGGSLGAPLHNGAIALSFVLDEAAELEVYVRHDGGDTQEAQLLRRRYVNNNVEIGEGYGIHASKAGIELYGDKSAGQTVSGTTKGNLERDAIPVRVQTLPLQPGAHTVAITVRDNELQFNIDDRQPIRTKDNLRPSGDFAVKVTGRAKIANLRISK